MTYRITSSVFVREEDGRRITVYSVRTGDGPGGQEVYTCLNEADAVRWIKNSILKPSFRNHVPKRDATPGVWWDPRQMRWRAAIWRNRIRKYLGSFNTEAEAVAARAAAEQRLAESVSARLSAEQRLDEEGSISILNPSLRNHDATKGVWFDARLMKWRAAIQKSRVRKYLGSFNTEAEAIAARKAAEEAECAGNHA